MPFTILPILLCCSLGPVPGPGISIKQGETIVFRLDGDRPVALRSSGSPAPGELHARLTFDRGRSTLSIVNNTSRPLNYRATVTMPGRMPRFTGVCTIAGDKVGRQESWPRRVAEVTIFEFRAAKPGEFSCE